MYMYSAFPQVDAILCNQYFTAFLSELIHKQLTHHFSLSLSLRFFPINSNDFVQLPSFSLLFLLFHLFHPHSHSYFLLLYLSCLHFVILSTAPFHKP
jgi:hypothetical protein